METQGRSSPMKAKKLNAKMMDREVENLREYLGDTLDDLDHARFEVAETLELIDAVQGVCESTPRIPKAVLDMIKGKLLVALETNT
jgi:hypothetical protein